MKKYLFIGIAGALGAMLRLFVKGSNFTIKLQNIPQSTLFINITGTFFLAFILTISFEVITIQEDIRLGITTGFLGAYTTFSTLCKEIVILLEKGKSADALLYLSMSIFLGVIAVKVGVFLAKGPVLKMVNKKGA